MIKITPLRSRRIRIILVATALVLLLMYSKVRPTPFDSERWKQFHQHYTGFGEIPNSDCTRARMVDELLRKLHPGMPISEGLALLGNGESVGGGSTSHTIAYVEHGYALTHLPLIELPWVLSRWRAENPYLYVRYENGKLVSTTIE